MNTTHSHRQIRASRLPDLARSQTRIVRLGVASASHFGDHIADPSGGYLHDSHRMVNHALRVLVIEADAAMALGTFPLWEHAPVVPGCGYRSSD
jgi:hypothetical protein